MGHESGHFLRRCHICGQLTERKEEIQACSICGKALTPFCYFDVRKAVVLAADVERPPRMMGESPALVGLTAYWPP